MARSSHETKSLEKYMGKADDLLALVAKSDVATATHPDPSFNLVTPGSGVLLWITGLVYDKAWLEGSVASNDRADLNLTFPQQFAFSVPATRTDIRKVLTLNLSNLSHNLAELT